MFVLVIFACALFAETAQPLFVTRRSITFTNLGVAANIQDEFEAMISEVELTVTLGDGEQIAFAGSLGVKNPKWPGPSVFGDCSLQDILNVEFLVKSTNVLGNSKVLGKCNVNFNNFQRIGEPIKQSQNLTCGQTTVAFEVVVPVELQPCGQRNLESGVCYSTLDTSDCYSQPDGKSCALDCPSAHFTKGSDRQCSLNPVCGQRSVNTTADTPCGNGCNLQLDGETCEAGCFNNAHYTSSNGRCVLKPKCGDRAVNTTADTPCGNGCNLQLDGETCEAGCFNNAHYTSSNGRCVLKPKCGDRAVNSTADTPCGNGCNLQLDGETCEAGCFNNAHYTPSDGRCILKPECVDRGVNTTAETPCGINCYLLQESLAVKCVSNCPDTHTGDETGVCEMNPPKPKDNNSQVNVAAIVVPVAVVVALAVVGGVVGFLVYRRRNKKDDNREMGEASSGNSSDGGNPSGSTQDGLYENAEDK